MRRKRWMKRMKEHKEEWEGRGDEKNEEDEEEWRRDEEEEEKEES